MQYDAELISGFIDETRDVLDDVEPTLIELSEEISDGFTVDSETINSVFRLFHSLKSSAAFLGFNNIASLTHEAETVLQGVREESIPFSSNLTIVLCKTTDLIRNMLDKIENAHNDEGFTAEIDENKEQLSVYLEKSNSTPHNEEEPVKNEPLFDEAPLPEQSMLDGEVLITDEMYHNFIAEGTEQLEIVEEAFLTLSKSGFDQQLINTAYRAMHSFKGNCGFMQFKELQALSHIVETIMDGMRQKKVAVDNSNISFLLKILDLLRETVSEMNEGGSGSIPDLKAYIDLLMDVFPECNIKPIPLSTATKPEPAPTKKETLPTEKEVVKQHSVVKEAKPSETPPTEGEKKKKKKSIVRQDIRVELNKLDNIINLVGELVIAESMVTRNPAVQDIDNENYYRATHQLRRICNELQDASMSLRMVPLTGIFKKMVRVVHDLSRKMDKPIKLDIIGGETEVDKTVIEQISDPLVHIIRNSCDHGLEFKEERVSVGKEESGRITIEGRHEGGEVWIIVQDDGRGLNREKITEKAISNGIIEADEILSDAEVWQLIFHPGFSTADQVSDVSGRGVGMDVVKRNLEKLNGRIDINTVPGHGTSMIIRIPLTLAIIDGMLIKVGQSQYTIPTLAIKKSLRFDPELITISPDGSEILRLRDDFIPIIKLGELLNQAEAMSKMEDGILIVVDDSGSQIALFADEIIGQQQTVIKGLSKYIQSARGTSGCTILGDGSVALILDIKSIVAMAEERAIGE